MIPPGLLGSGTDEEKKKAASEKPVTQTKMTQLLERVVKSYGCSLVEGTTSWLFERNEIEGKKKIVLAPPSDGGKGEGTPEIGDVWGVEMGVSLGTGKIKTLENRPTLHRRTTITYQLKRPSSRQTLSEIVKKFGTFPFSLRQLDDERAAKVGVVECVRSNVLRQYEVVADKDSAPVARILTTIGKSCLQPCSATLLLKSAYTLQLSRKTGSSAWLHRRAQTSPSTKQIRRSLTKRFSRFSSDLPLGRLAQRVRTRKRKRSLRRKQQRKKRKNLATRIELDLFTAIHGCMEPTSLILPSTLDGNMCCMEKSIRTRSCEMLKYHS